MTLSPFEVERREFGTAPMGYRKRDVDNFVDEVQRSLRDLWQERSDTREENERLKERLHRFEQIEEQLKNTLLLAQDSAEKAHEQARRESELIMREAGQKSRDIVHSAHEEKQKLEMVLRDLHSAEQEARQRLRAMSGAILSHLDDTEQLVAESSGTFRAIVQAHPEATELRGVAAESIADMAERAAFVAEAEAQALEADAVERIALDAAVAASAIDRLDQVAARRPSRARGNEVASLETGVAAGKTADAFFDAPPIFDPTQTSRRERAASTIDTE